MDRPIAIDSLVAHVSSGWGIGGGAIWFPSWSCGDNQTIKWLKKEAWGRLISPQKAAMFDKAPADCPVTESLTARAKEISTSRCSPVTGRVMYDISKADIYWGQSFHVSRITLQPKPSVWTELVRKTKVWPCFPRGRRYLFSSERNLNIFID